MLGWRGKTLFAAGLACLLLRAAPSPAAVRLLVSPPRLDLMVTSGGNVTQTIEVTNGDEKPVKVRAYLSDWTHDAKGNLTFSKAGSHIRSCGDWATLNPQEFEIPGGERQTVRFTLRPSPGSSGGYWAMIFFESILPAPAEGRIGIALAARVGTTVYASIAGTATKQGEITKFSVSPYVPGKPLTSSYTLKNTGNVAIRPKGTLEIHDLQGKRMAKFETEEAAVLPGLTRDFIVTGNCSLTPGSYKATVTLDFGAQALLAGETLFEVR